MSETVATIPVSKIATVVNGFPFKSESFSKESDVPLVRIRDLLGAEFETYVARDEVPESAMLANDDVVIGMDGDFNVKLWDRGSAALNQRLCYLRANDDGDARYIAYAILRPLQQINDVTPSTTVKHLSSSDVISLKIPEYDVTTQQRIADYLDREVGQIDAMVGKLDELAETLEGRRIDALRRATQYAADGTKWPAVPTAHLFASIGSGTTPKGQNFYLPGGEGIPWVTTSELRETVINATNQDVTLEALSKVPSLPIHPKGSVVIAMYGATIGRLGVLGVDATMNQACCAFSNPRDVDLRFFYYTLWAQRDDIIREAAGGGQPNISQSMLRRWRVPHPQIDEQKRIADHLDDVTGKTDAMVAKVAELKSLLIERRAALITDVVTGKKEVSA